MIDLIPGKDFSCFSLPSPTHRDPRGRWIRILANHLFHPQPEGPGTEEWVLGGSRRVGGSSR